MACRGELFLSIFTILSDHQCLFNLIDGINGLSGSIATLILRDPGYLVHHDGQYGHVDHRLFPGRGRVCIFEIQFPPAQIFMGDTGPCSSG
ncbi:MAG: hypothetical protein IPG32_13430 [Saprospirales bacterium]|nr:hypothetical protein [Saprospirales bacterium]